MPDDLASAGVSLLGRVAVVTGAASGIGRATSIILAAAGATVLVADTRRLPREGGASTVEVIEAAGGRAVQLSCDVTRPTERELVIDAAEKMGGVDILVNSAGTFREQTFLEVDEDDYDAMSNLNIKAVFFMAQAAARVMVPRRRGTIVNLSSVAGLQGSGQFTTYCTSKFAVRGLTYALADELGPSGIRVNAVHPGLIATSMTTTDVPIVGTAQANTRASMIPLRRIGTADDVARTILFLCSDLADYVAGSSLVVDGGRMRS